VIKIKKTMDKNIINETRVYDPDERSMETKKYIKLFMENNN
jgi:hypothetical protein